MNEPIKTDDWLDEAPETLREIHDVVVSRLLNDPATAAALDDDRAAELARAIAEDLGKMWVGQQVYLPRGDALRRRRETTEIWRRFNGDNQDELAREFGKTTRHINRILADERARNLRAVQRRLFPQSNQG